MLFVLRGGVEDIAFLFELGLVRAKFPNDLVHRRSGQLG